MSSPFLCRIHCPTIFPAQPLQFLCRSCRRLRSFDLCDRSQNSADQKIAAFGSSYKTQQHRPRNRR
ncbi:hypothetical protein PkP19E3_04725 [Pseudomonas koreensis]|nr:hypothetical protein PkP19E3_04725 [Pseudomonas koreensis]